MKKGTDHANNCVVKFDGNRDFGSGVLDRYDEHVTAEKARLKIDEDSIREVNEASFKKVLKKAWKDTIILYTSDNGEQHHSTASEWPMLLIGGSALGLVTGGRTVVYPGLGKGAHRQVSNLYNTLGHLLGAPVDDFGAEGASRVAEGPLAELMG